ncbi:beta-ketoacyl-ACP synthase [Sutterella massiliensis]|uniref:Beta-ketoacyl-ACP synthase n=1 Tax=Sutterella massiliensis TaxID=1816689 RepID=A0ABS2DVY7_9BURK|nr:beta-ketoacyl-ACP synthase [Sutterella massiliensis]MBM6704903.1 beta-ketoacyl-ACP synthase [Sutterella massiliensis]
MNKTKTLHRVVITGMAGISPLGNDWAAVRGALERNESGIVRMHAWENVEDLNTRVAAPAKPFELDPVRFSRKRTRSMGRVAVMAVKTALDALEDAGLADSPVIASPETGIAYGSSAGQPCAVAELANLILTNSCRGITATTYVRMMSHSAAVNIGIYLGAKGRIIPTSSACTSGSQGIGYAYETIASGKESVMIAGGSEELDATDAAIFDTLFATSVRYNDRPQMTPRPFDRDRDGLVVGEGAGTLILESLEHALARGARIYAEVLGFGTNSDGAHITTPQSEQMAAAMRLALEDAEIAPEAVDYVNGHGTATDRGDVAESHATHAVFGSRVPYSTYKGHMGHTLGACGALEAIFAIRGMIDGFVAPVLNLENPDPACAPLNYVTGSVRPLEQRIVMSNNFAFGGINTSLLFRKWLPGDEAL